MSKSSQTMSKTSWMRRVPGFLPVIAILVGLALLAYPTLGNLYNQAHMTRVNQDYDVAVENLGAKQAEEMVKEAREYNKELAKAGALPLATALDGYDDELVVSDDGTMGYITIPSIDVNMPIYHGVSDSVLMLGAGHLPGSSLPIGGKTTHCVLTGHTGMAAAQLFTDLDKVQRGDTFQLHVLGDVLTYQVDSIKVVLPEKVESLHVTKGEDRCTLVTCTPYGINSHRLLVSGKRVPTPEEPDDGFHITNGFLAGIAFGIAAIGIVAVVLLNRRRKKVKEDEIGN